MRLFGLEITRAKAAPQGLQSVNDRASAWWPVIREPFTGAWQRNREVRRELLLSNYAVFSCLTLIPSDIAKCRLKLVEQDDKGLWSEVKSAAFSPVMTRPNRFQNRIQFFENWIISKLVFGNTYVLMERDQRNVVIAMYVLDPMKTKPLVAPDGAVYYEITKDNLAGVEAEKIIVPASEVMHDRWPVTIHPLVGMPPLQACKLAAEASENIQNQSAVFFENGSRAGGILVAPGNIPQEDVDRVKEMWEQHHSGANYGRVAVLGSGLEYKSIVANAVDSQLVEQLGSAARIVTTAFNVPAYMVGVGDPPAYNNIEALNQQYYTQCLQKLFEAIEELLDEGLGLRTVAGHSYGAEFDLDNLLRMDTATRIKTYTDAIKGGLLKPDEGRAKFDLPSVPGGDQVYLQQQNFSLAALAKRDAKEDPFATGSEAKTVPSANDNIPAAELASKSEHIFRKVAGLR